METVEQLVSFNHIQVQLSGGAPWGFTLKGGLEHGEPLIITKIEDDGKAELSRKLRVGDELININGSALYGSRHEALILIKGSYRILKITVRRRTVPLIRPHSWHLARVPEPPLPPPPPLPSCLPPEDQEDSPPLPPPPPPLSTMQLHPGSCPLSWNNSSSSEHSDLQWGQLTRPYSSTDRSSSLGSMESLDTPTPTPRPYGDAHPSPVDSALSKRDSAYSSFSASSNASEYAAVVSLRPGEANSMDNLLQSLGPACRGYPGGDTSVLGSAVGEAPDDAQMVVVGLKSRSLTRPKTRPAVVKDRPSSCCYEEERRGGGGGGGGGGGVFGRASDDDKEVGASMNPPRPPTRKDSFRATRGRKEVPDTCCVSAPPDGVPPAFSCNRDDDNDDGSGGGSKASRRPPDTHNGCSAEPGAGGSGGNLKADPLECYLNARNQSKALRFSERDSGTKTDYISEDHKVHAVPSKGCSALPATSSSSPASSPPESSMENQGELQLLHPRAKSSSYGELHPHIAPDNLTPTATAAATATQLQSLHLNGDASSSGPSDRSHPPPSGPPPSPPCSSSCSSLSPLQSASEDFHTDPPLALDHCPNPDPHLQAQQNSWGGSRCSTPGSVFLELEGGVGDVGGRLEVGEGGVAAGPGFSPVQVHHSWGRSASVPGDSAAPSADHEGLATSRVAGGDFRPLSAAASVDSLLEEQRGGGGREADDGEAVAKKLNSSKNLRRNRRRSERFATNLRNEIQRKKAQLQTSRGLGGLLHSGATVHEEEGLDFQDQGGGDPGPSAQERSTNAGYSRSTAAREPRASVQTSGSGQEGLQSAPKVPARNLDPPAQVLDLTTPSFGVSIRVVEEPAPAGKARRWRWTPEHKLQPEPEPAQWSGAERSEAKIPGSRHGVCAFASTTNSSNTSSSSSSSSTRSYSTSRIEESEILPFADRMKFFEETSRSGSVASLCSPRRQPSPVAEPRGGELSQYRAQRRYSYQGALLQESAPLPGSAEARRQSVSTNREKEREKEREREREREQEREERARERQREREERVRERQREKDREERVLILQRAERLQAREREREKEREERVREWEREREREERERERQERAREWQREKERERKMEAERVREQEKECLERERRQKERERETEKERQSQFGQSEDLYRRTSHSFHHEDQPHQPQAQLPHGQAQDQPPRSAFYPVASPSQHQGENQGCTSRSYTPSETHPTRKTQEAPKLNRKYSLTERDYPRWSSDSVSLEGGHPHPHHHQPQHQHRPRQSVNTEHSRAQRAAPCTLALRGRAMSENDLRQHLRRSPAVSMTASQTLSEVDEVGRESGPIKKKVPPPPRPPPPKWEEFHRRRASHHNLYSSPHSSSSSPLSFSPLPPYHSIPPSLLPSNGDSSPSSQVPVELSRQRSYSLPPERHQSPEPLQDRLFAIAPPSPMFSRRAFRPVAPPPRERGGASRSQQEEVQENGEAVLPLPPPPLSTPRSQQEPEQETVETGKSLPRHQTDHRPSAHWERKRTPSPRMHCDTSRPPPPPTTTTTLENGVIPTSERYVTAGYEQQRNHRGFRNYLGNAGESEHRGGITEPETEPAGTESEATLSPSPAHSLEVELDIPMETDIDDYQEEEEGLMPGANPITSEHPCFALPVTVVETDIDTLPDLDASPLGRTRAESGSLEEEEELRVRGPGREQLSPLGSEGEWGTESWRGAYRGLGHDTDSLERHSGRSSSCSSHYGVPATRPQMSCHRKDPSDIRRHDDDDDDLTYKRQLMESLRKKLGVLREAQRGLQEDIRANAQLGEEVESAVVAVCKPNEADKFRMVIGDLDKVVSLLLSLSARLLRTQTSLDTLGPHTEQAERLPLVEKKRQLLRQLSEAQDLKEHVDRREQAVGRVLSRCLSPDQHRDYCHFVKMKAALLVEQRQLEDKTRLGEEQLRGLRESLDLGLGVGLSLGYGHY
ncbi:unnamed protein product [Lota lota]